LIALAFVLEPRLAHSEEQIPQTLPPSQTNPDSNFRADDKEITVTQTRDTSSPATGLPLWYALFVSILGGLIAWFRVLIRFQPFWGLGVSGNVYTISLIVVVGGLSGVCYLILAGETMTGAGLLPESWDWLPRFDSQAAAQTMTIVGGSALGQAVTVIGRFMRGDRINTLGSAQVEELKQIKTSNFFYVLIRESIATKMSHELAKLAKKVDQETIRITAVRLITDQITIGNVSIKEGDDLIKKISEMRKSDDALQVEQANYEILHYALRTSGFSQLLSRFAESTG